MIHKGYVPKKLISKENTSAYGAKNLWKFDLPKG